MIQILRDILNFFREEKFYALLFFLTVGIFLYAALTPESELYPKEEKRPEAIEQFRQAEERLQIKIKAAGSFEQYLKQRPRLSFLFQIFSILIPLGLGAGLLLDFLLFSRPDLRARIYSIFPETTDWKISMIVKVILLLIAAGFLSSVLLGFVNRFFLRFSENFFILFHTTLIDFLCLAFILGVVRRSGGSWRDLGFRIPEGKFFREVLMGWSGYLAVLPVFFMVLIALVLLAQFLHYEPPPHPLVHVFLEEEKRSPLLIIYSLFLAAIIGPIFEELFFRGFCYPILKKRIGAPLAMILTSAFFAWIHENTFAFWPIFVLGMGLVYLYEKRSSLVGPMVLHMTHNVIFIFYFFLAKQIVLQEGG